MNDHRGISTKLQRYLLLSCFSLERPTNVAAASEGKHFQAIVGDELFRILVGKWQNIEAACGPPALLNYFRQKERAKRCLRRRLEQDGASGGDGRRYLVRHEIQWKVERSDRQNRAKSKAF